MTLPGLKLILIASILGGFTLSFALLYQTQTIGTTLIAAVAIAGVSFFTFGQIYLRFQAETLSEMHRLVSNRAFQKSVLKRITPPLRTAVLSHMARMPDIDPMTISSIVFVNTWIIIKCRDGKDLTEAMDTKQRKRLNAHIKRLLRRKLDRTTVRAIHELKTPIDISGTSAHEMLEILRNSKTLGFVGGGLPRLSQSSNIA